MRKLTPVTSPRFASNASLQKASTNSPALYSGESGEAIRILQQEVDLGFPLPKSYQKYGSPDGIFGGKTMAKFDELLPTAGDPIPRYRPADRIHTVYPSTGDPSPRRMSARCGSLQYGIDVMMASGMNLGLSDHKTITLNTVYGRFKWDETSEEPPTVLKKTDGSTLQGCASHDPASPSSLRKKQVKL